MPNLTRYGSPIISSDGFRASPTPEEDGEWVKFDDIKEFLKPTANTGSPKLPSLKDLESAYEQQSIKDTNHRATEDELVIVRFCHNYMVGNFRRVRNRCTQLKILKPFYRRFK